MSDKPFREVASAYLSEHDIYSKDRKTMRFRLVVVNRYLGDIPLCQIGQPDLKRLISGRQAEGVAESTINRAIAAASAVFTWAIDTGMFDGPNPVRKTKKFREGPGRDRYLTPGEADRLILASPPHLQGIIAVALYSGARLREVLQLEWGDVDMEARLLTFRRETTKYRKRRNVPVSPQLYGVLAGLRRGRPDQKVFTWNERPLRSVRTAFEGACRKAGIEGVVFHSLRHTFSSWYIQNGGNLHMLQRYLGHSTYQQTLRYSHMSREALEDGARFIGPPQVRRPERERTTT